MAVGVAVGEAAKRLGRDPVWPMTLSVALVMFVAVGFRVQPILVIQARASVATRERTGYAHLEAGAVGPALSGFGASAKGAVSRVSSRPSAVEDGKFIHRVSSPALFHGDRNDSRARFTSSGFSSCGRWPHWGMEIYSGCLAILFQISRKSHILPPLSKSSPHNTKVGHSISLSLSSSSCSTSFLAAR